MSCADATPSIAIIAALVAMFGVLVWNVRRRDAQEARRAELTADRDRRLADAKAASQAQAQAELDAINAEFARRREHTSDNLEAMTQRVKDDGGPQ